MKVGITQRYQAPTVSGPLVGIATVIGMATTAVAHMLGLEGANLASLGVGSAAISTGTYLGLKLGERHDQSIANSEDGLLAVTAGFGRFVAKCREGGASRNKRLEELQALNQKTKSLIADKRILTEDGLPRFMALRFLAGFSEPNIIGSDVEFADEEIKLNLGKLKLKAQEESLQDFNDTLSLLPHMLLKVQDKEKFLSDLWLILKDDCKTGEEAGKKIAFYLEQAVKTEAQAIRADKRAVSKKKKADIKKAQKLWNRVQGYYLMAFTILKQNENKLPKKYQEIEVGFYRELTAPISEREEISRLDLVLDAIRSSQ